MNHFFHSVVLFVLTTSAFAGVNEEVVACSNKKNTIEINQCTANLAAREEARMKDELARSLAVLRRVEKFFAKEVSAPKLVLPLQRVHATWEKYRSAECQLAVEFAMGGSVAGLAQQGCLASLNEERANKLRSLRVEYETLGY